jgi:hypothetical protein
MMRKNEEVASKLDDLRERRLRERKAEFLGKCPRNCQFNCLRRTQDNGDVRFCKNEKVTNSHGGLYVCDSNESARTCPYFEANLSEAEVEAEFNDIVASPSRCGEAYPKLAILIWFLQDMNTLSRWERLKDSVGNIFKNIWYLISLRWY